MKLHTLRRNTGIVTAVLALSLGLAACGDDDSGSDANGDTSSSAPADNSGAEGADPGRADLRRRLLADPDLR